MTREEALEDIVLYLNATEPKGLYCENIEVLKQDLERLEAIDNANPNEALECLMYLKAEFRNYPSAYEAIKQALIKSQEQEKKLKALEIIKKKAVNVNTLINSIIGALNPLEFYNEKVSENLKLTKQEYDLLEDVLGK